MPTRSKEKQKAYNIWYRLNHKDKIKQIQDDYYQKHKEKRRADSLRWKKENPERFKKYSLSRRQTPEFRLSNLKFSAGRRNIPFELEKETALKVMSNLCVYCGSQEKVCIDREDNSKGYTNENSVPCCGQCNYMKLDYTKEEFLNQCRKITDYTTIILKSS